MKLEPKDTGDDLEMNMSPMIDMVFLLLIFFIVASQIVDEKPKVDIPTAAYAKVPEDTTGRLMITVSKDEKFFLRSNKTPVTLEELKDAIAAEIEADPKLRILIRADSSAKYKVTEKVTRVCAEVGAQDLIYSAFEE